MKVQLYLFCAIGILCSSCISYALREATHGEDWDIKENICVPDSFAIQFGKCSETNVDFVYHFTIDYISKDTSFIGKVKLNSFSLTLKKDDKPVSYQSIDMSFYSWNRTCQSDYNLQIDSLPFVLNINEQKSPYVSFRCKYDLQARKIRKLYVSYDIEIGNKRIIKRNVEYRRKWFIGLPH
jgi:hypothetical protein